MAIKNFNDKSLIIQFDINSETTTIDELFKSAKDMFSGLGYKTRKLYYSSNNKVYSPSMNRFCSQWDSIKDKISGLSIQSDYDKSEFEPNAELDIELNFRYIRQNKTIKYSIILNNEIYNSNNYDAYKQIISFMPKNNNLMMSGYSYILDNYFGPISFSQGILRKNNMPIELQKLASFYHYSNVNYTTIGIFNCFSCLELSKVDLLKRIFGNENVITYNSITVFYNKFIASMSIQDYFKSTNYRELCNIISNELKYDMFNMEM